MSISKHVHSKFKYTYRIQIYSIHIRVGLSGGLKKGAKNVVFELLIYAHTLHTILLLA